MRRTESYYLVTGPAGSERIPDQLRIEVLCRGHTFSSDVLASSKDARDPDRGGARYITLYAKINKIEERRCQGKPPPPITASDASAEKLASENLSHRFELVMPLPARRYKSPSPTPSPI